jgi:uncharacterized protein with NRDE domain
VPDLDRLAVSRSGQMAALTNYRDPDRAKLGAPSRGELVVRMAGSTMSLQDRLEWLSAHSVAYAPFNMMLSDGADLAIFESVTDSYRLLEPGVYGLSNHLLDTPWPKVRQAKSRLIAALGDGADDAALLHLLRDQQTVAEDELPRTGVSVEWERLLSSAFIRGPEYGTRCSTVIRIATRHQLHFHEWTWDPAGSIAGEVETDFTVEPGAAAS